MLNNVNIRKSILNLLIGLLSILTVTPATAQITLSDAVQLLIDDEIIASRSYLTRILHPAEKLPQPVLEPTEAWEANNSVYCAGTTVYDPATGSYKLWYKSSGTCYATSTDGINWTRPNLGLYSYGGNPDTNIVFPQNCVTVLHDRYESDPQKRYKMLGTDGTHAFWGAYSSDGLNWTEYPGNPVLTDGSEIADVTRDRSNGEFLNYIRPEAPHPEVVGLSGKRYIGLTTSADYVNWSSIINIIVPDSLDDWWVTEPHQRTEFYQMSGFSYGDMYLGLLQVFRVTDIIEDKVPGQSAYDGPIHSELVYSRDGRMWHRYEPREPIIANGPYDYDAGCIMLAASDPVIVADHIYHYYTAINTTHGGLPSEKVITIARAAWRRDGYVSLHADAVEGELLTVPMFLQGNRLHINAAAPAGHIKVEILTDDNIPIPGYTTADCDPFTADSTDHVVSWQGQTHFTFAQPVRLRFLVQNADLYSFTVKRADQNDPPVTAGLACHLSAAEVETITMPNTGEHRVAVMNDQSSNDNHARQDVATLMPAWTTDAILEKNVACFTNGACLTVPHDDSLNTDLQGQYTVIALARHHGPVDNKQLWLYKGCDLWAGYEPGWSYWFYAVSDQPRMYMAVAAEGADDPDHHAMTYKNIAENQYKIYAMILDGSQIDMFVDGAPRDGTVSFQWTYTGDINNDNALLIGADNISIAEILIYNRALSTSERQDIETYLADKYPALTYPPQNCPGIWKYGFGMDEDLNQDCYIDKADADRLIEVWLECYDPADPDCTPPVFP